jgi:sugar phosphate isomerase/epimerase
MARTRTGSIPIGTRCNAAWMSNVPDITAFAVEHGLECLDPGSWEPEKIKAITDAGLALGTVDLPQPWGDLASADSAKRNDAVDTCVEFVKSVYDHGARIFFVCVLSEPNETDRKKCMEYAIQGYGRLCEAIAPLPDGGARIAMEGYPGSAPNYSILACTPESCRRILHETGAANLGINFDPSHLLRMGIDPVRFAEEFAPQVFHIHGKDTEILAEGVYEYGTQQQAEDPPKVPYGGTYWRYTIPGHGGARWSKMLGILAGSGYAGRLGIELEDMNYNGTEAGEKQGLIASRQFLETV